MTQFDYDPVKARKERLIRRALDLHHDALRLSDDLREAEGKNLAASAGMQLSYVVTRLRGEGVDSGGQQQGSQLGEDHSPPAR